MYVLHKGIGMIQHHALHQQPPLLSGLLTLWRFCKGLGLWWYREKRRYRHLYKVQLQHLQSMQLVYWRSWIINRMLLEIEHHWGIGLYIGAYMWHLLKVNLHNILKLKGRFSGPCKTKFTIYYLWKLIFGPTTPIPFTKTIWSLSVMSVPTQSGAILQSYSERSLAPMYADYYLPDMRTTRISQTIHRQSEHMTPDGNPAV